MENYKEFFESRTSIRRYEREAITPEQLEVIYAAIRNTPTSYNGQQFTVVDVTDQELKEQLYAITNQKQIKTCNHFMFFCADFNRIAVLAKAKGINMPAFQDTMDGVIVGIIDAALAMQNAVVAARLCGLGSCCIGYARTADPIKIAELLKLPKGTFVVCGLAIGVPREQPDVKPKLPTSLMIHQNHYRTDDMAQELLKYDADVIHYNQTRTGSKSDNDWCDHILDYYREALKYQMLNYLNAQGCTPQK